MTKPRATFESYHIHLQLAVDESDKYVNPETRHAWRTWQACRDATIQATRKTESYYVNTGNLLKAQVAKTIRTAISAKI